MRPGSTRWAASSGTVGRNGTGGSATMSAASSAATRVRSARFADRLVGSPEIYGHKEREPEQSINFVTCHDGFTLNDLVSYNQQAQRSQRRRQPRRRRRQPELELRRRGADRRSGGGEAAEPADEEFSDRHDAVAGHADDPDGRRGAAHAAAATTTPTARTTRSTGSTGRCSPNMPTCTGS